jgi:hypothetical protein
MTRDDLYDLPGTTPPVLLDDGKLGMLVLYPLPPKFLCGVQVPGEEEHRWIDPADLTATTGGALRQEGAPVLPDKGGLSNDQALLLMDWIDRGGADEALALAKKANEWRNASVTWSL